MRRFRLIAAVLCLAAILGTATFFVALSRRATVSPAVGSADASWVSPAVAVSLRVGEVAADQPLTVHVLLPVNGDLPTAERYLHDAGLVVTVLPLSGLLTATGPERAVASAFHVRLYRWHNATSGENFYANDSKPMLPFAADGVFGLDDAFRLHPLDICQNSPFSLHIFSDCGGGFAAAQVRNAYNVQSLWDAGTKGDGQTVAIYALSGFSQQYIDDFDQHNNLIAPYINVTKVIVGHEAVKDPTLTPGPGLDTAGGDSEAELELDIEAVHAIAEHAAIHVYEMADYATASAAASPGTTTDFVTSYVDFLTAVAYFHEHIASISAGACESDLGGRAAQYAVLTRRLVEQAHITVFASSGDNGKLCLSDLTHKNEVGVQYPASDPWATAVGGTYLDLKLDGTLKSEASWDQPDAPFHGKPSASGGGPATFPRPNWQIGVPAGTKRLVPDVAAISLPGLTIAVNPKANHGDEWRAGGGTSLAAPLWAGLAALYDDFAQARGADRLGFANPLLYQLAEQPDHALFDVTTDQNGGPDLAGHAGTGWDFATGLGSFNGFTIIHDAVGNGPTPPSHPPLGDACLVGKWVAQNIDSVDGYKINGQVVHVSGQQGVVLFFTSDGMEIDDLNSSQPLVGTYNGQQVQIVQRGTATFHVLATGTTATESGPGTSLPTAIYVNGVKQRGTSGAANPGSFNYACTAKTLQIQSPSGGANQTYGRA